MTQSSSLYLLSVAGLQVGVGRLVCANLDGLGQHLVALTSARASGAHQEDTVTNSKQLRQLYHTQNEVVLWGETHLQGSLHNHLQISLSSVQGRCTGKTWQQHNNLTAAADSSRACM